MLYKNFSIQVQRQYQQNDFYHELVQKYYPEACERPWLAYIRHSYTNDTFHVLGAASPLVAFELARFYIDLIDANKERDRARRKIEQSWSLNWDERWS
jgi:hypothetical protein